MAFDGGGRGGRGGRGVVAVAVASVAAVAAVAFYVLFSRFQTLTAVVMVFCGRGRRQSQEVTPSPSPHLQKYPNPLNLNGFKVFQLIRSLAFCLANLIKSEYKIFFGSLFPK